MAAPTYATDLVDISTCEAIGTWVEPTATGWTSGAAPAVDGENFIQQANAISKAFNATGVGGMIFNAASGKSIVSPAAVFGWMYWASPQTLDVESNGGLRMIIGDLVNAFYGFKVGGKDTYAYGGWVNFAVDPNFTPRDYTAGSPTGTWQWFGAAYNNLNAITKGSPCLVDVFRYGRELRVTGGEAANYATFPGAAAKNDANDAVNGYNRWGLFQAVVGGYLHKGLFLMGLAATVVDFRDSNRNISIQNCTRVAAAFSGYEVRNASSRVDWTNIIITALGTTSKGFFLVTDNADVNLDSCVFTDMDYFTFLSASTILNTTFRRCGLVTQNGATFTNCIFDQASGAVAIKASDPSLVTGCSFVSDGTGHAMEASAAGAYDWDNELSGYAASDGSTGNEAFYNNSGGHIDLTVIGGTAPSVRNGGSSTTDIILPEYTLTISGIVTGSDVVIYEAGTTTVIESSQNIGGTSYNFSYTGADVGSFIDIGLFIAGYRPFYIRNYELAAVSASIPAAQAVDIYYLV